MLFFHSSVLKILFGHRCEENLIKQNHDLHKIYLKDI